LFRLKGFNPKAIFVELPQGDGEESVPDPGEKRELDA
jgi:hypothetical protein